MSRSYVYGIEKGRS
nr:hypothetical protein [Paenibacillus elgii]